MTSSFPLTIPAGTAEDGDGNGSSNEALGTCTLHSASRTKLHVHDSALLDIKPPDQSTLQTKASGGLMRITSSLGQPRVFKGGEGIQRILKARDQQDNQDAWPFMQDNYWSTTLCSVSGRALPLKQWLIYMAFVVVVVPLVINVVPRYETVSELRGLQFPMTALGTALFLLMAFRTNSCYDRWWEGRKIWGSMGIRCLDMGRAASGWVALKDARLAQQIIRLTIVYSVVFKKWLRKESDYQAELVGILSDETTPSVAILGEISGHPHPVVAVVAKLTEAIHKASEQLSLSALINMETQLQGMIADAQGCARIIGTPMPFAYIVHLRSFMVLWLAALPFAFIPSIGYWSIVICGVVAYQLLGFEDIGVEIESPFGNDYNDLPCDQMNAGLHKVLIRMLEDVRDREVAAGDGAV